MRKMSGYFGGVLVMIASSALFSFMSFLIRYASGIDPFKMALFRFAIGMSIVGTLAVTGRIKLKFTNLKFLALRGIVGGAAVFLFYLSISKIGIAKGTVISNTYPLFATILGVVFLKERVKPWAWMLIAACFAGLFLLSFDSTDGTFRVGMWHILAITGAIASGFAVVFVRKLSETDSPFSVFMSQCLFGFWIVLIPANLSPSSYGIVSGVLLLGIGVTAAMGQLTMTWAYGKVDVSTGSLLSMLMVVFNVGIGVIVFQETQSITDIIGILIVVLSCAGIVYVNRGAARVPVPEATTQ